MLVSSYNNQGLNDVLIVMLKNNQNQNQHIIKKQTITQIQNKETNETVGYNFFEASRILGDLNNGPIVLDEEQVMKLNEQLVSTGFAESLSADVTPKIVVGYVEKSDPVKDSDHLQVTSIDVGADRNLQIVCGAANIEAGQKVVVAREGAIMPNGLVIWSGELRGVKSEGMVCSAKELGLDSLFESEGILVLPDEKPVGEPVEVKRDE